MYTNFVIFPSWKGRLTIWLKGYMNFFFLIDWMWSLLLCVQRFHCQQPCHHNVTPPWWSLCSKASFVSAVVTAMLYQKVLLKMNSSVLGNNNNNNNNLYVYYLAKKENILCIVFIRIYFTNTYNLGMTWSNAVSNDSPLIELILTHEIIEQHQK